MQHRLYNFVQTWLVILNIYYYIHLLHSAKWLYIICLGAIWTRFTFPCTLLLYTADLVNQVEQHGLKSSPVRRQFTILRLLSVWQGCTAVTSVNVSE
jgi:hypothetical protein